MQLICGPTSTAAIADDGALYLWGNNTSSMLGLGRMEETISEPVEAALGYKVVSVALGAMHGLAVVRM